MLLLSFESLGKFLILSAIVIYNLNRPTLLGSLVKSLII